MSLLPDFTFYSNKVRSGLKWVYDTTYYASSTKIGRIKQDIVSSKRQIKKLKRKKEAIEDCKEEIESTNPWITWIDPDSCASSPEDIEAQISVTHNALEHAKANIIKKERELDNELSINANKRVFSNNRERYAYEKKELADYLIAKSKAGYQASYDFVTEKLGINSKPDPQLQPNQKPKVPKKEPFRYDVSNHYMGVLLKKRNN